MGRIGYEGRRLEFGSWILDSGVLEFGVWSLEFGVWSLGFETRNLVKRWKWGNQLSTTSFSIHIEELQTFDIIINVPF